MQGSTPWVSAGEYFMGKYRENNMGKCGGVIPEKYPLGKYREFL